MPRFREPKICPACNTTATIKKYEGKVNGNYITPDPKTIPDLILMERFDEISWLCVKCGRSRAVEVLDVPLYWIYCSKHGHRVSVKIDKCSICDSEKDEIKLIKKQVQKLRGEI